MWRRTPPSRAPRNRRPVVEPYAERAGEGPGSGVSTLDVIVGAFQGLIFAFKHPSQFVIMGGILLGIFLVCEILGRISDKIQSRKREW